MDFKALECRVKPVKLTQYKIEIEGQEGIFEIRKMKLMYEVIALEKGFLKKDLKTREIKIIRKEK